MMIRLTDMWPIPSPGTPGEGQGGGPQFARDKSSAPSPALPRSTLTPRHFLGERKKSALTAPGKADVALPVVWFKEEP